MEVLLWLLSLELIDGWGSPISTSSLPADSTRCDTTHQQAVDQFWCKTSEIQISLSKKCMHFEDRWFMCWRSQVSVLHFFEHWGQQGIRKDGDWGLQRETQQQWNLAETAAHDWLRVCCSLLHATNSLLFVLLPSLIVLHTHGLLATFISGASLSSLAMIQMLCWLALYILFDSSVSSHWSHLASLLVSFIPPLIYLVLSCLVLSLPYPNCPIAFASFTWSLQSLSSTMVAIHGLSITVHLAGFQVHYMLGSRMGFYPAPEQP